MKQVISAVVAALVASEASAQQAVQWRVENGGNGHWYRVVRGQQCQIGFSAIASQQAGYLATITSAAENLFVASVINQSDGYWTYIGLIQSQQGAEPGGGWRWVSDEPLSFTAWGPTEPNNGGNTGIEEDFAIMFPGATYWVDYGACATDQAVVEWSADCNGDGIVDYGQCRDGSLPDYNLNNIPDCCENGTPCTLGDYPVQWRVEDGGNGHWYRFNTTIQPWSTAQSQAEQSGGYLACISSAAENNFVRALLPASVQGVGYLGGVRESTGWRWVSGEPWAFTDWNPGEPNGTVGEVVWIANIPGYPVGWNDQPTFVDIQASLVEWSADCNNDGIVDYGQILSGQFVDANQDGVLGICQCPGDITRNGIIDGIDLAAILGAWGTNGQGQYDCDINNDGIVDGADLAFVLGGWGACTK